MLHLHYRYWFTSCVALIGVLAVKCATTRYKEDDLPLNLPSSEINSLYELYNATDGPSWRWANRPDGVWHFSGSCNPCTEQWQGISCTSVQLHGYVHVRAIMLDEMDLRGQLPNNFDQFIQLDTFQARINSLTGTIPQSFGNISTLLSFNVEYNRISGSIPAELGSATTLQVVNVGYNLLTGRLPESFANIPGLLTLVLVNNMLTGSIPPSYGTLMLLKTMLLGDNQLTGTVPPELGKIATLVVLELDQNRLTGTLPAELGNLTALWDLDLSFNLLTGSIPATLCNLHELSGLYLIYNLHNGTIPDRIGDLQQLIQMSLYFNRLSGSIPESVVTMKNLVGLGLNNNRLTGTIPPQIGEMASMAGCRLHNNRLHGPIPNTLNSCVNMVNIMLFTNSLTGTIPSNIGELKKLGVIQLFDNKLTGTVPGTISGLPELTVLMLGTNRLTGSVDGVVNATGQRILNTVQLDNNQLTGTLPREIFALPALIAFSAVSNCFRGSLPDNICTATQLSTLALDGLSSATSCQNKLLPKISNSYQPRHPVTGTVPSCLIALPNLKMLHLSGNGFTGGLPTDLDVADTLMDLSLSHNQLRGAVPISLQIKEWYNLDLSFNYLQGDLVPEFVSQRQRNVSGHLIAGTSLSLHNNRLSGRLPRAVTHAPTLSVLRGNLFSCDLTRSDLPQNDDHVDNYQCGSLAFDAVYYAWLACTCLILGSVAAIISVLRGSASLPSWKSAKWEMLSAWYFAAAEAEGKSPVMPHLCKLYRLAWGIVRVCTFATVILLVCFLPLYALGKTIYSTHKYLYAWTVSAAYQTGSVPMALQLAALVLFVTWFALRMGALRAGLTHQALQSFAEVSPVPADVEPNILRSWLVLATYAVMNTVLVVAVNSAFVYATLRASSSAVSVAQVALALFKIVWNHVSSSGRFIGFLAFKLDAMYVQGAHGYHPESTNFVMLAVALFNTIAIPCLVVLVISPDCYYNVFVGAPAVTSQYMLMQCTNSDGVTCLEYTPFPQTTSYNPPFTYSYQCSSSLITYYAPAFVYMCLMASVATPLQQLACLYFRERLENTCLFKFIDALVPRILVLAPPAQDATKEAGQPTLPSSSGSRSTREDAACHNFAVYFNARSYVQALLVYVGVLLTFGLAFPPLAVCVGVTVLIMSVYVRLCVGRFVCAAQLRGQVNCLASIEKACATVGSNRFLLLATWMLVTASCWFCTLFLFDTLGDAVGFDGAYWVLIVVPTVPLMVIAGTGLSGGNCLRQANSDKQDEDSGVELSPVTGGADQEPVAKNNGGTFNALHQHDPA